jgi:hypothetical protein
MHPQAGVLAWSGVSSIVAAAVKSVFVLSEAYLIVASSFASKILAHEAMRLLIFSFLIVVMGRCQCRGLSQEHSRLEFPRPTRLERCARAGRAQSPGSGYDHLVVGQPYIYAATL